MDGTGEFTWSDGRKYKGQYLEDKKHGYGEFEWKDGRKYKGNWAYGKQHGKGVYVSANGQEKDGEWYEGRKLKPKKEDNINLSPNNQPEIKEESVPSKVL